MDAAPRQAQGSLGRSGGVGNLNDTDCSVCVIAGSWERRSRNVSTSQAEARKAGGRQPRSTVLRGGGSDRAVRLPHFLPHPRLRPPSPQHLGSLCLLRPWRLRAVQAFSHLEPFPIRCSADPQGQARGPRTTPALTLASSRRSSSCSSSVSVSGALSAATASSPSSVTGSVFSRPYDEGETGRAMSNAKAKLNPSVAAARSHPEQGH